MRETTLPVGKYGDTTGYSPTELTPKLLAKYRSGLHAANPGEVVLLVRQIDRERELSSFAAREVLRAEEIRDSARAIGEDRLREAMALREEVVVANRYAAALECKVNALRTLGDAVACAPHFAVDPRVAREQWHAYVAKEFK